MSTAQLAASARVTLDADGNGSCSVGPTGAGETWPQVGVSCHVSTNTAEAICRFYVGATADPPNFAGGTTWGSTGDSASWNGSPLTAGQYVFAVWAGGDPGATAYLNVTGVRQVA